MTDSHEVFYTFEEPCSRTELEQLFTYLDTTCDIKLSSRDIDQPTSHDIEEYIEELDRDPGLFRGKYEGNTFSIMFDTDLEEAVDLPHIRIRIKDHVLRKQKVDGSYESEDEAVSRFNEFYSFLADFYEKLVDIGYEPVYVYGFDFAEGERVIDPDHPRHISSEQLLDGEIPGIYWFQIVPPEIANQIGVDQFLSAPAYRVEQLTDGAVFLAVNEGVNTRGPPEYGVEEVSEHLGLEWAP